MSVVAATTRIKWPSVQLNRADLPQSALDLIGLIGMSATAKLIQTIPGIKFPVPRGEANNAEGTARFATFVEIIGEDAARLIVKHYGGSDIYVPSCKKAIRAARDRQIVADYERGSAVLDLAIRYSLSYRQIETILKTTDTTPVRADSQTDLFAA